MFDLTQEEHRVILFLVAVSLLGVGGNVLFKTLVPNRPISSFTQDLGKVKLNSADKQMLMVVSGIGEKLAARIIEYRDNRAGFNDLDELREVKGITDSKFSKIKEYLAI